MRNLKATKELQSVPYRDAIAQKIAGKIIVLRQIIVHWLQQLDRLLSIKQKKALLLIFCLACSSYCSYLFFHALSGRTNVAISFGHVPPVAKPPPSQQEKDSIHRNIK
jgi:hypothetical protein